MALLQEVSRRLSRSHCTDRIDIIEGSVTIRTHRLYPLTMARKGHFLFINHKPDPRQRHTHNAVFIRPGAHSITLDTSRIIPEHPKPIPSNLNQGKLGSGDIEGIDVGGQLAVSLLLAIGADQSVDFDNVDLVELLQRLLDLSLVGLDVDDEDEGVAL